MRTRNRYKYLVVAIIFMVIGLFVVSLAFGQEVTKPTNIEELIRLRAEQIELQKKIVELEKQVVKSDTPSMKQARKEVVSKLRAEAVEAAETARDSINAQVTGCDPATVWISPKVSERSRWRVMTTIEVINVSAIPIDEIRAGSGYGVVVRNLCPGGSITLSFVLRWEDSDNVRIPLTAISRTAEGGIAVAQSSANLNRMSIRHSRVTSRVWQVRLNRQRQVR
jgi:hypothetical protein